jgi:hypothetical protein
MEFVKKKDNMIKLYNLIGLEQLFKTFAVSLDVESDSFH